MSQDELSRPRDRAAPTSRADLTVVLMAFNEEASIEATAEELLRELTTSVDSFELLIVDDGSNDATGPLAERWAERHPSVRVIHHPENAGLGGVYRTGFADARGRKITFFPADGQFPASIIGSFLPLAASHDLVLGEARLGRVGLTATCLSWCERFLYRCLLGPMPRFQGIFMIDRAALQQLSLRSSGRGWAIVMEMILRARDSHLSLVSVPTPVRPRLHGASKVRNLSTMWANLRQLIRLKRELSAEAARARR